MGLLTPDRILPNTDGTFCCQAKGLYCVMDFPENSRSRASDYLINDRSGSSVSGCNARLCCTGFFDLLNVKALACFRVFGGFVGRREVQCYEMIAALAAPCHVHGVGTASVVVSCYNLYGQGKRLRVCFLNTSLSLTSIP